MNEEQREKIFAILHTNQFAVVATNSIEKAPESAVVAISETPDLEIVFGSFKSTRKNENIARDAHISVVVGWDNSTTVQIEGEAVLLEGQEREKLEDAHCLKNELSNKYRNDPRQEYFKIIPYWIRYSDFSIDPQEVWEAILK